MPNDPQKNAAKPSDPPEKPFAERLATMREYYETTSFDRHPTRERAMAHTPGGLEPEES